MQLVSSKREKHAVSTRRQYRLSRERAAQPHLPWPLTALTTTERTGTSTSRSEVHFHVRKKGNSSRQPPYTDASIHCRNHAPKKGRAHEVVSQKKPNNLYSLQATETLNKRKPGATDVITLKNPVSSCPTRLAAPAACRARLAIQREAPLSRTAPTCNFGGGMSVPICYEVQQVRRGNATHQLHGRRHTCRTGRERATTTRGGVSIARTAEPHITDRTQVSDLKRLDQEACLQLS